MFVIKAWTADSEETFRTHDPRVAIEVAHRLVADGMRVSIGRTDTGESVTVTELQDEARAFDGP